MVSVSVGIYRINQFQIELVDQLDIHVGGIQHRVNDNSFSALTTGEQVGIGRAVTVKQLPEDHAVDLYPTWPN